MQWIKTSKMNPDDDTPVLVVWDGDVYIGMRERSYNNADETSGQ